MPFRNNTFDIAFVSCLLHHVDDPQRVIRELVRTSKRYVVICEPNRNSLPIFVQSLLVKCERKGLKFSKTFLKRLVDENMELNILAMDSIGVITPNFTPNFLTSFLRVFDKRIPLGFYNVLIAEKIKK